MNPDNKLWAFLDDERDMPVGYDVKVRTAEEAIELIKTNTIEQISLDYDLGIGYTSGDKVAEYIFEAYSKGEIDFVDFHPHTKSEYGFEKIMDIKRKLYKLRKKKS